MSDLVKLNGLVKKFEAAAYARGYAFAKARRLNDPEIIQANKDCDAARYKLLTAIHELEEKGRENERDQDEV